MPSTKHCTWPLLIWKRHSIMYPDVSSGGLCASSASRSVRCGSYRAYMKMPEVEWVLVATWVKSSAWKWASPYCSARFWKRSPKSFVQDVPGKTCMPGHHHWITGGTAREADPLEDQHGSSVGNSHRSAGPRPTTLEEDRELFVDFPLILCLWFEIQGMRTYNIFDLVSTTAWKEKDFWSTWAKLRSWCLGWGSKSGKDPCGMCLKGVGTNSIFCGGCSSWIHKKCSGIPGRLKSDASFMCKRCTGQARPIDGRLMTEVTVGREKLEVVPSFCYLGDWLFSGGSCELATIIRYCVARGKFDELLHVLTSRSFPITSRGRVYNSCIRSAMLHASETWA